MVKWSIILLFFIQKGKEYYTRVPYDYKKKQVTLVKIKHLASSFG